MIRHEIACMHGIDQLRACILAACARMHAKQYARMLQNNMHVIAARRRERGTNARRSEPLVQGRTRAGEALPVSAGVEVNQDSPPPPHGKPMVAIILEIPNRSGRTPRRHDMKHSRVTAIPRAGWTVTHRSTHNGRQLHEPSNAWVGVQGQSRRH